MMLETIIVGVIIAAAAGWLIWRAVTGSRTGGCSSCVSANTCPFASGGKCPSPDETSVPGEEKLDDE